MNTISQKSEERRRYKKGRCEYLLNDDAKTAWIVRGERMRRWRRFRLPEYVMIDGERYTVESIEIGAYDCPHCLKRLVIPDSIAFVDEYNFSGLHSLRSVHIGKGLEYISSWIFQHNNKLCSFTIDKDNAVMCIEHGIVYSKDGKCAFTTPFNPKHLHIKEGVEVVENVAFWYNKNLESVHFPSTLKEIGDNSFAGCPKLEEVVLPEGFKECVIQCFQDNPGLKHVDLPSTLQKMEEDTFHHCDNLETFILRCPYVLETWTYRDEPLECAPRCTLYVPEHLVESYKQHPLWRNFKNIKRIEN